MSSIFLSYPRENEADAAVLQEWLLSNGWDDVFIDLDPKRGFAAGDEWAATITQAIFCADAFICVVSEHWAKSDWCPRELDIAYGAGRKIFPIAVDKFAVANIPSKVSEKCQYIDLTAGIDHEIFYGVRPDGQRVVRDYSVSALERLRSGLIKADVGPTVFRWPPSGSPDREPYRGLQPYEDQDAGIFVGREAAVAEVMRRLARSRQEGRAIFLPIIGASGSGKSSFLRAGILSRLQRDKSHFSVAPIIRPETKVITGRYGFAASLAKYLTDGGTPMSTGDAEILIAGPPDQLAAAINSLLATQAKADSRAPAAFVIAMDQAEELFRQDGSERDRFLTVLDGLRKKLGSAVVTLATIRSDAFHLMQNNPALRDCELDAFSLPTLSKSAYRAFIEAPALALKGTDRAFNIEPDLIDELLKDAEGNNSRDALSLLALAIERLYRRGETKGKLTLADYKQDGGIAGAMKSAITSFESHSDRSSTSIDPKVLRRSLFPWLVGFDADNDTAIRKVATRASIPTEVQPAVDKLIIERLAVVDQGPSGEPTVEIGHEALMRQWSLLRDWIAENVAVLKRLDELSKEALRWNSNGRGDERLNHTGARLSETQAALKSVKTGQLGKVEAEYLVACEAKQKAIIAAANRTRRRLTLFAVVASLMIISSLLVGIYFLRSSTAQQLQNSAALSVDAAYSLLDDGRLEAAAAVFLRAGNVLQGVQRNSAQAGLKRFVADSRNTETFEPPAGTVWPTGKNALYFYESYSRSVTRFKDGVQTTIVSGTDTDSEIVLMQESLDGSEVYIVRADGTAQVQNAAGGGLKASSKLSSQNPELSSVSDVLTRDGYLLYTVGKAVDGVEFEILDLNTGERVTGSSELFPDLLVDISGKHYLAYGKNLLQIVNTPKMALKKLTFTPEKLNALALESCFVTIGEKVPPNIADFELELNIAGSRYECRPIQDDFYLTDIMTTSSGEIRTDSLLNVLESAATSDNELKSYLAYWFGGGVGNSNVTWMERSDDGYIGVIYNRDLYVFGAEEGPNLHIRHNGGPTTAAFGPDHTITLADPGLGLIRTYHYARTEKDSEGADGIATRPLALLSSCTDVNGQQYRFDRPLPGGGKIELTRLENSLSEAIPRLAIDGVDIGLPVVKSTEQPVCLTVSPDTTLMLLEDVSGNGRNVIDLAKLRATKSLEQARVFKLTGTFSSATFTRQNDILTTNSSQSASIYRYVKDTGWILDSQPVLSADDSLVYAEFSPGGDKLLVAVDSGLGRITGRLYSTDSPPRDWGTLGTAYKWFSAAFVDNDAVLVNRESDRHIERLPQLDQLLQDAALLMPKDCRDIPNIAKSRCWPREIGQY